MGERVFFPFSFSLAEVSCRPDVRQHQLLLGAALTRGFGGAGKKRSLVQHHRPSLMGVDDKVRSFPGRVNVREIFQVQRPLPVSGHRPRQYQTIVSQLAGLDCQESRLGRALRALRLSRDSCSSWPLPPSLTQSPTHIRAVVGIPTMPRTFARQCPARSCIIGVTSDLSGGFCVPLPWSGRERGGGFLLLILNLGSEGRKA
jgi:hypothetical protein